MRTTLVSYIWANALATSENLLIHWCWYYSAMPIDSFRICLNVNSGIDDSDRISKVIKGNLINKDVSIIIDKHSFSDRRKIDFMNSFVFMGDSGDLFVPCDADELIDYDLTNESKKLLSSRYQSINGRLVDMVSLTDGKIICKSVTLSEPIQSQFPYEHDISVTLKRGMHKIVLIRGGNKLSGGHHYYDGWKDGSYKQTPVKVRHYCWTDVTYYNRSHSAVSGHPIYKKICEIIKPLS